MNEFTKFTIVQDGEIAVALYAQYKSLIDAGFTKEDALTLVIEIIRTVGSMSK